MSELDLVVVGAFQNVNHQTYPAFQNCIQEMHFDRNELAKLDLYEAWRHAQDKGQVPGEIEWTLYLASILQNNEVKMEKLEDPVFLKFSESISGFELNSIIHLNSAEWANTRECIRSYCEEASIFNSVSMYVDAVESHAKYLFTEIHSAFDIMWLKLPAHVILVPQLKHLTRAGLEARANKVHLLFNQKLSMLEKMSKQKTGDFFDDTLLLNNLERHFNISEMLEQYNYLREKVREYSRP